MITEPDIAAIVPNMDMAPDVPFGTRLKFVISLGNLFEKKPISVAQVSAVEAATTAKNNK